ncbi:MAG: lytic transglycosylase domain-containing protein, partial [Cyanobacteriota bacterium]|nr:lytic transglycosylase domain-containing protein [Cyanobacteriota bacterium]
LWRLNVRWVPPSCEQHRLLHRSQNPVYFREAIQSASARHGVNPALLLAVAKQESRFSPGVRSIAGAIGVMQLMPATASSIAGEPLQEPELMQPSTNILLGAAYMRTLLQLWGGDAFLSVASYNAGPGTVSSWPPPSNYPSIEFWVEQIPYAETRYYTKKVLDNMLSYSGGDWPGCDDRSQRVRQTVAEANAGEKNNPQQEERELGRGHQPKTNQIEARQQKR